jgi:hypothetical protein
MISNARTNYSPHQSGLIHAGRVFFLYSGPPMLCIYVPTTKVDQSSRQAGSGWFAASGHDRGRRRISSLSRRPFPATVSTSDMLPPYGRPHGRPPIWSQKQGDWMPEILDREYLAFDMLETQTGDGEGHLLSQCEFAIIYAMRSPTNTCYDLREGQHPPTQPYICF